METHDTVQIRSLGPGRTVDNGDQLGSPILLGLAVAGSAVAALVLAAL